MICYTNLLFDCISNVGGFVCLFLRQEPNLRDGVRIEFYIGHCCPLVTTQNKQLEERVFDAKGFFALKIKVVSWVSLNYDRVL